MAALLFTPARLRDLDLANRIVVSPMCQYSAVDGTATDWHLVHYGSLALSGAGLVILEATHVESRGRITQGCLGLYADAHEEALTRIITFVRERTDARIGIQLSHSGRKGSARLPWIDRGRPLTVEENAWTTVAPSALPFADGWPPPRAMDGEDLQTTLEAHVEAVRRAERVGFDLIEVHIAHGYLLHSFLSPLSNRRNDDYGGSMEGRMRYPLETFEAMRAAWPAARPMGVRVTACDWVEGGWQTGDAAVFARELARRGCDYIAASSGGTSPKQSIPLSEGYQTAFASQLRQASGLPTMAMGMIFNPHTAEAVLAREDADFIALARAMLHDPHWPWLAAATLGENVAYPPQYVRGYLSPFLREQRRLATGAERTGSPI